MIDIQRISVVLLPPKHIADQAILISEILQKKSEFTLSKILHPHITLYMTDILTKDLSLVLSVFEASACNIDLPALTQETYRQKKSGYVDVLFSNTTTLQNAQRTIAEKINPLRRELVAHKEILSSLSELQRKNVLDWGYPDMGELFEPHMTFSRLKETARDRDILTDLPSCAFSFTPTGIALSLVGEHGTCTEILKEIAIP